MLDRCEILVLPKTKPRQYSFDFVRTMMTTIIYCPFLEGIDTWSATTYSSFPVNKMIDDKNAQASEFESLSAGLIVSEHNFGPNLSGELRRGNQVTRFIFHTKYSKHVSLYMQLSMRKVTRYSRNSAAIFAHTEMV